MVRGRGDRHECLPLLVDVDKALTGYLHRDRPRVECRSVFLRAHAPTAELSSDGVSNIVRAACRRAGLPEVGSHSL